MSNIANINVANDVGAVGGLRKIANQDKEQALRAVAKQFEAIMMQQMLKTSRETSFDDGFGEDEPGTGSMDSYREWRDEQLAQNLSTKGSLGLADMLVKQLLPKDKHSPKTGLDAFNKEHLVQPAPNRGFSVGWWKSPAAADVVPPVHSAADVALPSTQDALLLHKLLQARAKEQ
jgi:Rod binding domain-containing protein